jgi:catechol-2,3-dioxygenase
VTVLAESSTAQQVYPGLLGFLVVAGMGLALFFLFRSLNKQLHKIAPGQPSSGPASSRRPRAGLATFRAMQAERARAASEPSGAPDQAGNATGP